MTTSIAYNKINTFTTQNQSAIQQLIEGLNANIETSKNDDMIRAYKVVLMAANDLVIKESEQKMAEYKNAVMQQMQLISGQNSENLVQNYNNQTYKSFRISKRIATLSPFIIGLLFSLTQIRF